MTNPRLVLLRAAQNFSNPRSCRWIAGRRLRAPVRALHTTPRLRKEPGNSSDAAAPDGSNGVPPEVSKASIEEKVEAKERKAEHLRKLEDLVALLKSELASSDQEIGKELAGRKETQRKADVQTDSDQSKRLSESKVYGSAKRRALRNRPEIKNPVPAWFIEKNFREYDKPLQSYIQIIPRSPDDVPDNNNTSATSSNDSQQTGGPVPPPEGSTSHTEASDIKEQRPSNEVKRGIYQIDEALMNEIVYSVSAGFHLSADPLERQNASSKPHLILQSPKDGAEIFLDSLVKAVSEQLEADIVTVDAHDIAEITDENQTYFSNEVVEDLRLLPFDAHVVPEDHFSSTAEEGEESEEAMDPDDDEMHDGQWRSAAFSFPPPKGSQPKQVPGKISDLIKNIFPGAKAYKVIGSVPIQLPLNAQNAPPNGHVDPFIQESKAVEVAFVNKFLDTVQQKRIKSKDTIESAPEAEGGLKETSENSTAQLPSRGLIIHIKNYLEIKATRVGGSLLQRIHDAVAQRRRWGEPIVIVGTTSSSDLVPSMSKSGFKSIQAGNDGSDLRTIITHCRNPDADAIFTEDAKYTVTTINCRNILAILRQRSSALRSLDNLSLDDNLGFGSEQVFMWGLSESVWPLEKVQRMVGIALGTLTNGQLLSTDHLTQALTIIESSDDSKFRWLDSEKGKAYTSEPGVDQNPAKRSQDARMRQLLKQCNNHEKKLLNGVIDTNSIKTTFTDVRAPPSTVEALKTLTSLSLVRPDAFKYGVLATDKIPGLLLYGPPGTGKTLLAKAVAKESGATVLEVSGSDIFDKYVGEGEKNVRAIFSLAKKLSPCVVFIDEADAIFGSRNTSGNRTSHRELINEFLREWDGMNTMSAFIMVATNRPFDLDDAVLRRLPRRLLVDLPTEKDRESILEIHLRDENLATDVSLADIASQTPFYSGSDLKNLSVAAALACVREENEIAAKHTGEGEYKYPERRTLNKAHFDKAMQEIGASISEDMGTLTAIRKFDEKYGDRKGRKKPGSWGFGTMTDKEREKVNQEEGRIRNADTTT